jgi:hypothetical protein
VDHADCKFTVFESGEFRAIAGAYAAGIGTGLACRCSSSTVGRISVIGGSFLSQAGDSTSGCGLGSGHSFGLSSPEIDYVWNDIRHFSVSSRRDSGVVPNGTARAPGLDCPSISSIGGLEIANGSYTLVGGIDGAGPGSGNAQNGGMSTIETIRIADCFFEDVNGDPSYSEIYPVGLGSGRAAGSGRSIVHNLLIDGRLFHSVSGIGSSRSSDPGSVSAIEHLEIDGGNFLSVVGSLGSAGIGAGFADSRGESRIGNMTIGNDSFIVTGGPASAGIGSGYAYAGGQSAIDNLALIDGVFSSGTGGEMAAVIGSGRASHGSDESPFRRSESTIWSLNIMGGVFSATAGSGAAAIGSGLAECGGLSAIGILNVVNGSFNLSAGSQGSGIGSGLAHAVSTQYPFYRSESMVRVLNIMGGEFSARGGIGGAAIGSSSGWYGGLSTIDILNVIDGYFSSLGGEYAPGIGSGSAEGLYQGSTLRPGESRVDVLNLVNGTFTVTGGIYAPGIGSGLAAPGGRSTVGCLAVFGASYIITGGEEGGGIGSGYGGASGLQEGQSTVSSLFIADGNFSIQGSSNAAGIGSGRGDESGRPNIDRLEIQNGSFRIAGGAGGSGIGAVGPKSFVTDLIILDGVFKISGSNTEVCIGTARGAAIPSIAIQSGSYNLSGPLGIGSSGNSFVGAISIGANSRTVFLDCSSVSDERCVNATSIYLRNSSIDAIIAGERFLSFESVSVHESKLWVEYMNTSVLERITGISSLHFSELVIPIDEQGLGKMRYSPFELSDESLTREGDFHSSAMTELSVVCNDWTARQPLYARQVVSVISPKR